MSDVGALLEVPTGEADVPDVPGEATASLRHAESGDGKGTGAAEDAGAAGLRAYATSTNTRRNIAALRLAGWRLFVTPTNPRTHGMPYAIDNGAWSAHRQGIPWEPEPFLELVARCGDRADFVVLPDVVGEGKPSLRRSLAWRYALRDVRLLLLPTQDGMTADMVRPHVGEKLGLFVGGTTEWKLSSLPMWADLARETGCYLHVGRVNTRRRIRLCQMAGANSFDGTSVTRYAVTLPKLDDQRRQEGLWRRTAR